MNDLERVVGKLEASVEALNKRLDIMHVDIKKALDHECRYNAEIKELSKSLSRITGIWSTLTALGAVAVSVTTIAIQYFK